MIIFSNLASLFTIMSKSWIGDVFISAGLLVLGWIYQFVSYSFKLFTLMCQMNFNSIAGFAEPLIDRLKALVMVLIMFKLAISLISYLFNPDSAPKEGKQLLINIGITAVLLISYQTIFNLMNDINMLIVGKTEGSSFTVLPDFIDVDDSADEGLISRFIFGNMNNENDLGDFVGYKILSIFIYDTNSKNSSELTSETLGQTIGTSAGIDFSLLRNISVYVNKTVTYIPFLGTLMGAYIIYSVVKCAIQIGIRAFKLILLQILAPIAIIAIIQDGVKKGMFKKFVDMYVEVFIEAAVRLLSMLISIVFITKFISNIGTFFSESALSGNETFVTKGLLIVLVCVAGFKFANEMPKMIDKLLGTHMAEAKGGFGSFVGGLVGSAIGGATALGATIAGGGGIGTGLANMVSGQVRGFSAGAKGNNISDKIKNISGANAKTKGNVADMISRGGFGAVAGGAIGTAVGTKTRQDRQMTQYDKQLDAIKKYEDAQRAVIADSSMCNTDQVLDDSGTGGTVDANIMYSEGFSTEKLTDNKDSYVERMMEYDNELRAAQASYDAAQSETDKLSASRNLAEARAHAKQRASDYYDKRQEAASSSGDDRIETARENAQKQNVDVSSKATRKSEKQRIEREKRQLENKQSYKNTHSGS